MAKSKSPAPSNGDAKPTETAAKAPEATVDKKADEAAPRAEAINAEATKADAPQNGAPKSGAPKSGAPKTDAKASASAAGKAPDIKLTAKDADKEPSAGKAGETIAQKADEPRPTVVSIDKSDAGAVTPAVTAAERARQNPLLNWLQSRAATIAIAAALGALVGTMASSGIGYAVAVASADRNAADPNAALRASVSQLTTEIASLKAAVGAADKASTGVLADIVHRLESADKARTAEAQPEMPKVAALDPSKQQVSREITGSVKPAPSAPIARDWRLWRVEKGRALVEGRGAYFEVAPGSTLPGLGLVQRIMRQGDRWVVQTRNGLIVPRS